MLRRDDQYFAESLAFRLSGGVKVIDLCGLVREWGQATYIQLPSSFFLAPHTVFSPSSGKTTPVITTARQPSARSEK